jgi:peptide/nickel transport system permease protein
MFKYAAKRLLAALPVLLGVSLLTFLIMHLTPGDPATIILGPDADPVTVQALRHKLGLDQPLPVQYAQYLGRLVRGDLGTSIRTNQPVSKELGARFPYTLELTVVSLVVSVVLGLGAGVLAAVKKGTIGDTLTMITSLLGVSAPSFWVGLLLMMLFSYVLRWLPASGRGGPLWTLAGWETIMMPAVALGLGSAATIARMTRSSLLEVLNQDFIRTARAKGLPERLVVFRHALSNAMIPVVTIVGLRLGFLLGGSVIVEQVFAWPGIGTLVVTAIGNRDVPVVQAAVLLIALSFVLINVVVDLIYGLVDPRIRYN